MRNIRCYGRLVGAALVLECCNLIAGCGKPHASREIVYKVNTSDKVFADGDVDMHGLLTAINERLDGAGRASEQDDGQIRVDVSGDVTPDELKAIKLRICGAGLLEFRIAADPLWPQDAAIVASAKKLGPNEKQVVVDHKEVAKWVAFSEAEFGAVDQEDERLVKRSADKVPEALVLTDSLNVTGVYILSAVKGTDARGNPAINFGFDERGSALFRQLTSANIPDPATGRLRYLAIIFDNRIISAPSIREIISDYGQISGGAMRESEVDAILAVLGAGALPQPVVEVTQP